MTDDRVQIEFGGKIDELAAATSAAAGQIAGLAAPLGQTQSMAQRLSAALLANGNDLAKVTPEMLGLGTAAAGTATATKEVTSALSGSRSTVGTATREFRALFDELSSHRYYQAPSTIAILLQRVAGLSPAALVAVGGIFALGYGLLKLVESMRAATAAAEHTRAALSLFGVAEAAPVVDRWVAQLREVPGVSDKAAGAYVQAIAGIRGGSDALKTALVDLVPIIQQTLGTAGPKFAAQMGDAFSDLDKKGGKFLETLHASPATVDRFYASLANGDRVAAFQTLLGQVVANLKAADRQFGTSAETTLGFWQKAGMGAAFLGAQEEGADDMARQLADRIAGIDDNKLKKIADDLAKATATPASNANVLPPESVFRDQLEKLRDDTQRSNTDILNDEIALYQQRLASGEVFGEQRAALQTRMDALVAERNRAAGSELVDQAHERVAAIAAQDNLSATQRLTRQRAVWAALLAGDTLTYDQRLAAQRSYDEASAALDRQRSTEARTIAKQDAATDIQIARETLAAKKSQLAEELAAKKITAQQWLAAMRDAVNQEYQLDLKRLEDEEATLAQEPAEYDRVYNEIRLLKAKLVADLAALDRQAAADQKKALKTGDDDWKSAANFVSRQVDTMTRGILMGTQTWQQALSRFGADMVANLASAGAKAVVNWAFEQAQKLAITNTTNTAIVASDTAQAAASTATQNAVDIKPSVMKHAGSAAAAVYDDVAQIPYVGWLLAPPAAAAAFAAVSAFGSFDVGAWQVPGDMLAQIHRDEMIIPASQASLVRAGQATVGAFPGGAAADSGGGGVTVIYAPTVQAIDGQSAANFLKNQASTIAGVVAGAITGGNAQLKSALAKA